MQSLPNDIKKLVILEYIENYDRLAVLFVCKDLAKLIETSIKEKRVKIIDGFVEILYRHSFGDFEKEHHMFAASAMRLYSSDHICWATRHGYLDILVDAYQQGLELNNHDLCHIAVKCGHLDILKWLYSIKKILKEPNELNWNCVQEQTLCSMAIKLDNLEILRFIYESSSINIIDFDKKFPQLVRSAIDSGYLHILQWLIAKGASYDEYTLIEAVDCNQLHILQWLYLQYPIFWTQEVIIGLYHRTKYNLDSDIPKWLDSLIVNKII